MFSTRLQIVQTDFFSLSTLLAARTAAQLHSIAEKYFQ